MKPNPQDQFAIVTSPPPSQADYNEQCARHAAAAGAFCIKGEGDDDCCTICGVWMVTCDLCNCIGYHRETCSKSEPKKPTPEEDAIASLHWTLKLAMVGAQRAA
jgi:hypothetical protein